ncbi:hypothetical protein [Persicitalea sp.]|uniref:hypothetical protein n=1 Tax=Persicitalea sp. TaxID=3100273 RepID=UPI003594168F
MNALRLTTKANDDRLIIELPERLRGKELTVLISEKPVVKKLAPEVYEARMKKLEGFQLEKEPAYESPADEWYLQ